MASLSLLSFSLVLLLLVSASACEHHHKKLHIHPPRRGLSTSVKLQIQQACKATRFSDLCESSLANSSQAIKDPKPATIVSAAVLVALNNLQNAQGMVQKILDASSGNQNRTTACKNCLEYLSYSNYRLSSTITALKNGKIKDGRAWTSAGLTYQYDCWSALKYANDTQMVGQTMAFLNNTLIAYTSNALSMMLSFDVFRDQTNLWAPPKTERDGFWEGEDASSGSIPSIPENLKPDVTVCSTGCDKKTVQEAVNMAPDNKPSSWFVIYIKTGLYQETVRVPLSKQNVVFLGDGMGKTVITGSLNVGMPGISTFNSATVGVVGDGFMASNLTIQNTAGPDAHQAVAFRSDSDQSILENCELLGNQDTVYAHALRQLYKSCNIEGNVDFIFGNSASIFQDCTILVPPRQLNPEKGENNAVTAHGRTDPAQSTGFVFNNCLVNGTDAYMKLYHSNPKVHKNFLGRPWKEYSRTVYLNCKLEELIAPQGWLPWDGEFALNTLYYGEFHNSGKGANVSGRVPWSSQIPAEQANAYTLENFIQSGDWNSQHLR